MLSEDAEVDDDDVAYENALDFDLAIEDVVVVSNNNMEVEGLPAQDITIASNDRSKWGSLGNCATACIKSNNE